LSDWVCWLWLWLDWLCVVVVPEEELPPPPAAFAIAAPPPATTPSVAAVAMATRSRFMIDHLLPHLDRSE
jgi:hypothetical protein